MVMDLAKFVIDYMRHGKVFLPIGLPKPSLLQKLFKCFGFEDIPSDAVDEGYSTFQAATAHTLPSA